MSECCYILFQGNRNIFRDAVLGVEEKWSPHTSLAKRTRLRWSLSASTMRFCGISGSLQVWLLCSLLLRDPWLNGFLRRGESKSCLWWDLMYPSRSGIPFSESSLVRAWQKFSGKKQKWLATFQHHLGPRNGMHGLPKAKRTGGGTGGLGPSCRVLPGTGLEAEGWCTSIWMNSDSSRRLWPSPEQNGIFSGDGSRASTLHSSPSLQTGSRSWLRGSGRNREGMSRREIDEILEMANWLMRRTMRVS